MLADSRVSAGSPRPLGATPDDGGTSFAVWAGDATRVELCLYDDDDLETARVELERTAGVFHARVAGVGPGQRYGYRAHGPYAPERGMRFNPHKLLVDPYARAIDRVARFAPELLGDDPAAPDRIDVRDGSGVAPRSVVVDPRFEWGDDRPPGTELRDSLIYECHVKGLTALHPDVEPRLRGTFLGLSSEPVIAHLRALGVTALELMPVQCAFSEQRLVERSRVNYWGYNTLGFFAPDPRFRAGSAPVDAVTEIKHMVRALHRAGIEVILDVVYNHSAEADALGPTLSLRGLGNATYYRLDAADARRYRDFTGCGNTLDLRRPQTLQLVADSLRYWVEEVHVDGFRLDLASALVRGDDDAPHPDQGLCALMLQDPVLSRVKLIVEPWDLGPAGMQLGRFPSGVSEWCSRYRDCVLRWFRGDAGQVGELATRLAGSSDLFGGGRRAPQASVNYVACHDGLTLRDLTSYARPIDDDPRASSSEPSTEPAAANAAPQTEALELHDRLARSLLATLAFSLGVPMLQQGDEMGRSQGGLGNPYDRDDATSYVSWRLGPRERALLAHARRCFELRRALHALRRTEHFRPDAPGAAPPEVRWLRPDGADMQLADWNEPERRSLAMLVAGHDAGGAVDARAPSSALLLNAGEAEVTFHLPRRGRLRLRMDTARPHDKERFLQTAEVTVAPHALCLLEDVLVEDAG